MSVKIAQLKKADMAAARDLNHLMKQLREGHSQASGSLSDIQNILDDKKAIMIVAKDGNRIVGVATLYIISKIGKNSGRVEDVVVDSAYRGHGLGEKIMRALIKVARAKKIKKLNLTSRPGRVAANKLYQKLGFELRKTNPYALRL